MIRRRDGHDPRNGSARPRPAGPPALDATRRRPGRRAGALSRALATLALPAVAGAYEIRVSAEAKPAVATIGDIIAVEGVIVMPAGFKAVPQITATATGDWEIREIAAGLPAPRGDGTAAQRVVARMAAWTTSPTATPEIPLTVIAPGVEPKPIRLPAAKVRIESVLATAQDPASPRPPKGPVHFPLLDWLRRGAWALAFLAAAAAGWLWWRARRRAAAPPGPPIPSRPPDETARLALDALLAGGLPDATGIKAFYSALGDILRRYLEERFGIAALERTTAELLPVLRAAPELREHVSSLRAFLDTCDLVKFARLVPPPAEIEADAARVRAFVDATAGRPAASPAAEAAGARA